MRATRLGRPVAPEQASSWLVSHAAYPTPLLLEDGRVRVYFNTRDRENRGCLAWLDLDVRDPMRVLDIAAEPGLRPGLLGTFDDRGISNGSIHRIGDELWLYYMGWNRAVDAPFRNAIGLAVSTSRKVAISNGGSSARLSIAAASTPTRSAIPTLSRAVPGSGGTCSIDRPAPEAIGKTICSMP